MLFQNAPMFALFAEGVAAIESGAPDPAALQEVVRQSLRDLMPIFENLKGDVDLRNLSVTTPFGSGTVESLVADMDVNGLVVDGKYDVRLTFSGLVNDPHPPTTDFF